MRELPNANGLQPFEITFLINLQLTKNSKIH